MNEKIIDLENKIAELEEEKGNMMLQSMNADAEIGNLVNFVFLHFNCYISLCI